MMPHPDYLDGAIDLHVHSSPDVDPRRYTDYELAEEARKAGMAALLIKSHQGSTVERAWLVSRVVKGIEVYGGLVLNDPVGGFNPAAVDVALRLGARQIWMPTRSAANHRRHHGQPGGLTIVGDDGSVRADVIEILRLIGRTDCILGTGHLSPEEALALVPVARAGGVKKILVTHPEWDATHYSIEQQRELAAQGGVYFERCFVSTTHRCGFVPFSRIEQAIAQVGDRTTVVATDLGQPDTPAPVDGLRLYAEQLRAAGFSAGALHRMLCENPRLLLEAACAAPARPETA